MSYQTIKSNENIDHSRIACIGVLWMQFRVLYPSFDVLLGDGGEGANDSFVEGVLVTSFG